MTRKLTTKTILKRERDAAKKAAAKLRKTGDSSDAALADLIIAIAL